MRGAGAAATSAQKNEPSGSGAAAPAWLSLAHPVSAAAAPADPYPPPPPPPLPLPPYLLLPRRGSHAGWRKVAAWPGVKTRPALHVLFRRASWGGHCWSPRAAAPRRLGQGHPPPPLPLSLGLASHTWYLLLPSSSHPPRWADWLQGRWQATLHQRPLS